MSRLSTLSTIINDTFLVLFLVLYFALYYIYVTVLYFNKLNVIN